MVERRTENPCVAGSIPALATIHYLVLSLLLNLEYIMPKSDFTEIHQSLIKNKSTELTIREINFSDKVDIDGLPGAVSDQSWFSCLTLPKLKSLGK